MTALAAGVGYGAANPRNLSVGKEEIGDPGRTSGWTRTYVHRSRRRSTHAARRTPLRHAMTMRGRGRKERGGRSAAARHGCCRRTTYVFQMVKQTVMTLRYAHCGEHRAQRRIPTKKRFLKQRMKKRNLHTLFLGRRTLNTMIVANYHHSYINDRCRGHQTSTHRHAEHQRNLGGHCNRRQRPLARSLVDELVQIIVGHGE